MVCREIGPVVNTIEEFAAEVAVHHLARRFPASLNVLRTAYFNYGQHRPMNLTNNEREVVCVYIRL